MKNDDYKLDIIYEDDYIFAINKPSGITVNKSETVKSQVTVQDLVIERFPKLFKHEYVGEDTKSKDASIKDKSSVESVKSYKSSESTESSSEASTSTEYPESHIADFYNRDGIIHRIDKDTSGLLLVAKDPNAFVEMQKLFKNREIHKSYLAVVYDHFSDIDVGRTFTVDAPISRNPNNREKFAVVAEGKKAKTEFIIKKFVTVNEIDLTILECKPISGRTHQIRVHLTAMNHPVVGDKLYSGSRRYKRDRDLFKRMYLHASKIQFIHPILKEEIIIESPLPSDITIS